jgi:hypothetical protein
MAEQFFHVVVLNPQSAPQAAPYLTDELGLTDRFRQRS